MKIIEETFYEDVEDAFIYLKNKIEKATKKEIKRYEKMGLSEKEIVKLIAEKSSIAFLHGAKLLEG